jgi:excisionase family DNA binding protein
MNIDQATAQSNKRALLDDFYSVEELAGQLGIHQRTLRKFAERGEGPPETRIGRKILYSRTSVIEWLASREQRKGRGRQR